MAEAALRQLQKYYDVQLTYTSNAIERLTQRETAEVIDHGITVGGKGLKDRLEAVDHYEAVLCGRKTASAISTPSNTDRWPKICSVFKPSCTSDWTLPWGTT